VASILDRPCERSEAIQDRASVFPNVSRETMTAKKTAKAPLRDLGMTAEIEARLTAYLDLLAKWNPRINLVGPKTLDDAWTRHILDSAQLVALIPGSARVLVDLGSGAGLPGLILAIFGSAETHLIEADARKCAFLREAVRVTGAAATIHNCRIEAAPSIAADVVTARALAPLEELLPMAARFFGADGRAVFLKGARWAEELTAARKSWHMTVSDHPSLTDPAARVLSVESLSRG
jgi:16S rRNA (guanine527-N7)-methyltransferase